jgi:hypothetical protein
MKKFFFLSMVALLLTGCFDQPLREGDIPEEIIDYVNSMYEFDQDETILIFSSKIGYKDEGSFFTNKRIGAYWLYENATPDKYIKYAMWEEVESMSFKYGDGWTKASLIIFDIKDGSEISTKFNTDTAHTDLLYKEVKGLWKQYKGDVSEEIE